ncbi:hypothetical protein [Peribacillus sp. Hz7]|uniref:hypothetical protein n=1 Tax=Peribacillus sp. Hz7 TaxID=3344873 RepID=UPI0035CA9DD1
MAECAFCKIVKPEDEFYMYSETKMTRGRIQKGYVCEHCSNSIYGDKWYPITGYDQVCEISKLGTVREIREDRYYNITHTRNASVSYVYLTKNDKKMKKHIQSLMKRFIYTGQ